MIDTITGANTNIKVAMFTLAANVIGKTPNPTFAGPSKLRPKATKQKIVEINDRHVPQIANGSNNCLRASTFNSL